MITDIDQAIADIFAQTVIWDGHSGFMPDVSADLDNLSQWKRAGVDYLSINVGFDVMPWSDTVRVVSYFRRWFVDHANDYVLAKNTAAIRQAKREGKMAITFDIEGMNALNGRVDMVQFYYDLGVRQMLFAYNRNNLAGGVCHDDDHGLTAFGREVIGEMNRLGMVVDVSHCGYRTSMDVMGYSRRPVIFSHSNAKAIYQHGRNITDEQIRACAATGGLVGLNGLSRFMGADKPAHLLFADHVAHMIDVAGPRHVGIALDFGFPVGDNIGRKLIASSPEYWPVSEGYGTVKTTYLPPSELRAVAAELMRRGYDQGTVADVFGGNFLRLAESVWR